MRASRLLSLLMLLQSRGHVSAQSLAQTLEVSVRTVYRDVDELSAAGVPIWADRGRAGGFQLQAGWRTRVDGLTAPEAQAMFLGGLPGPASELGLGEAMASAQLKLLAALPDGWRDDARRVSARFHLDPIDWYRGPAATDHLPAIAQAVWGERRIAMRYDSWRGEVARRVEPLGLVLKAGVWYLVARPAAVAPARAPRKETRDDLVEARTYRVSNVLSLEIDDQRFDRPASFDLAAWWVASTRRFEAELARETALLSVSREGMKKLSDVSAAVAAAAQQTAGREDGAGWRRVTIPIESVSHAARLVMSLGAEARVLKPAAVRRELLKRVEAIAALYDDADADAV